MKENEQEGRNRSSRKTCRHLSLLILLALLLGCSKELAFDPLKPRPTPVPIPSPSAPSFPPWPFPSAELPQRLHQRALAYDQALQAHHVPNGLVVDVRYSDPTRRQPVEYKGNGDLAFNTGGYVAAEAFRLAVTGDPAAADNLKRALEAVHRAIAISGVKGLLARGYWKANDPGAYTSGDDLFAGEGPYSGLYYMTDTSGDQYISVMFGYGAAYDFLKDEAVKAMVRQDVADIADHIWDHGLQIVDKDGQRTEFGDLAAGPFHGFNAMICLNFFHLAAHITGNSRYADIYRELIDKRYYDQYVAALISGLGNITSYFNYNLAAMNLYHLLRLENGGNLRRRYEMGFDYGWWRWIRQDHNSFFNFVYAAVRGGEDKEQAIERAVDVLARFPEKLPFNSPRVINSNKPWLVDYDDPFFGLRLALGRNPIARVPLPPDIGPPTDFRWQRDSRETDGGNDQDFTEFPGADYLLAYWMGRYYGYIPAP